MEIIGWLLIGSGSLLTVGVVLAITEGMENLKLAKRKGLIK